VSTANPAYAAAMRELRRSNAAQRHKDQHAEARKGWGKGGRAGARQAVRGES
jgi:hypothetical protein